jgi:hypothetical protein
MIAAAFIAVVCAPASFAQDRPASTMEERILEELNPAGTSRY